MDGLSGGVYHGLLGLGKDRLIIVMEIICIAVFFSGIQSRNKGC